MTTETTEPQQPVKFGLGQIGNKTPNFAKWFFRVFFYVTQTVNLGIILFSSIPAKTKLEITEYVTFANLAAHGFSKMFGIEDDNTVYYDDYPLKRAA